MRISGIRPPISFMPGVMGLTQQSSKSSDGDAFSSTAMCAEPVCTDRLLILKRGQLQDRSSQPTLKPKPALHAPLTSRNIEQHNATSEHNRHENIEKVAADVQGAAKSLGFELPPGWRTGGLDDVQKSPMDRWLEGPNIFVGGRRHLSEGNCP
ncbi:hypothetical protein AOQ84DRAFT_417372 [Glonium stellatum]|uniref:Uncharacterized protein n=1 Tax=Glonium stellatum TaxID=574774 RepID=A0A8E2ESF7_9PEZI|nr:hypothetical protein AOQ84DRAFT_417372 [Glonium stellatum]